MGWIGNLSGQCDHYRSHLHMHALSYTLCISEDVNRVSEARVR